MLQNFIRDGHAIDLLLSRAPRFFDSPAPATVGVELTNICQLACPHCDAQHASIRGRSGFMSAETFSRLRGQLRDLKVRNLRLIGGGEPTLHPRFSEWVPGLRGLASFLSVTTNGQRLTPAICEAALSTLDMIEVSVASDHAAGFEQSRGGGDFDLLLANLSRLHLLRARMKSRTLIHIRIMLRPSDRPIEQRLVRFWGQYGDVISTQALQDYFADRGDIFPSARAPGHPLCVLPFRALGVKWTGDVPLCRASSFQTGTPQGLVLGNVNTGTLASIWNGAMIQQYRAGHRSRRPELMPLCKSCPDPQSPRAWRKVYRNNDHLAQKARTTAIEDAGCGVPRDQPAFIPVAALSSRPARRSAG